MGRAHHCQADTAEFLEATSKGQGSPGGMAPGGRTRRLDLSLGSQGALSFSQRPAGESSCLQCGRESVQARREDQLLVPSGLYPIHRHSR